MKYNVIGYLLSEGFRNVLKNKKSTLSCIGVMVATMIVFGMFFAIGENITHIMENVKEAQGMQVFIKVDATEDEQNEVEQKLRSLTVNGEKALLTVDKVTKEEAYNEMLQRLTPEIMGGMTPEFFKVSFVIIPTELEYSEQIQQQINTEIEGIESIQSKEKTINALISIGNGISLFTLVILVILVIISLFIISNTIKLSVHARRKEISIMKYVGATNNFIRAPFIVEGVIMGIVSGLISTLAICLMYNGVVGNILKASVAEQINLTLLTFNQMVNLIVLVYLGLGVGIGMIGSIISMRKYLDV
ncbi:MAG: permease-like cell division protein FtsX [Lachnospiraceae bacterium]|nr:permease-like cell division protein FtsX [Lachnospiraceae bacterium]